jgi:hypothetical protein
VAENPLTAAFVKLVPGQNARAETFPDRYDLANAHKRERREIANRARLAALN